MKLFVNNLLNNLTYYNCLIDALFLFQNLSIEKFRLKVHATNWNNNLDFKARPFPQGIFIDLTCDVNQKFIINVSIKIICIDNVFRSSDA